MPQAKKAVAKKAATELVSSSMYEEDVNEGFEETGKDDYTIPFLKILQKLSPQCDETEGDYLPEAKPGLFFNVVSKNITDSVRFIVCHYQRIFIEWQQRDNGGGFVAQYDVNEGEQLAKTAKDFILPNENIISDTRMFYVLLQIEDDWRPAVISMASTQIKKAKMLMSSMDDLRIENTEGKKFRPATFASIFKGESVIETKGDDKWFGWKTTHEGMVDDPELYALAKSFRETIKSGDAKVDHNQNATTTEKDADTGEF